MKFFKQSNIPVLILSVLFIKGLFFGAAAFEVISIIALSVLFGYKLYLDHIKKPDFSQVILDKFEEIEKSFQNQIKELDDSHKARAAEYEAKVSTLTLAVKAPKSKEPTFGWG